MKALSHHVLAAALAFGAAALPGHAFAVDIGQPLGGQPQVGPQCSVQIAAQAAYQRRLAVIDASKTNVSSFFSGANSCIGSGLLSNINLSSLIPDLGGLLAGGLATLAQQALTQAEKQVCQVVNGQIQSMLGSINSEVGSFESSIGGNLGSLMGTGSVLTPPNLSNFGNYNLVQPVVSSISGSPPPGTTFPPPPVAPLPPAPRLPPNAAATGSGIAPWLN